MVRADLNLPLRATSRIRRDFATSRPKQLVDQVLWPEFKELSSVLAQYLDEVTTRLIRDEVHGDTSEAHEVQQPLLKP